MTIAGQTKPRAALAVITVMEHHAKFEELRALLKLARQLRASAAQTADITYVGLFLKTACALEERARQRALPSFSARIEHQRRAALH
jgi:hypothetical protein